jgi:hypothetical protein
VISRQKLGQTFWKALPKRNGKGPCVAQLCLPTVVKACIRHYKIIHFDTDFSSTHWSQVDPLFTTKGFVIKGPYFYRRPNFWRDMPENPTKSWQHQISSFLEHIETSSFFKAYYFLPKLHCTFRHRPL